MLAIARLCRLLGCALDPQPLVQPPISDRAIVRGGRHRQQPREEQPRRAEGEEQVRWTSLPGRLLRRFGRDHDDLPSPHIAGRRARLPLMQPVCQPIRASRARACRRSTRLARLSRKAPASLVSRQPPRRFPSLTTAQVAPAPPARHRGTTPAWDRQRERRGSKASVAAVAPCGLKVRTWARIARAYVTSRTHTRDPQLDPAHKGPCSEEAIHTHDRIDERQVEEGTLAAARRGLSFFLFRVCVRATLGFGL